MAYSLLSRERRKPTRQLREAVDELRRPGFDPNDAILASIEARRGTTRTIQMAQMIEHFSRTLATKQ